MDSRERQVVVGDTLHLSRYGVGPRERQCPLMALSRYARCLDETTACRHKADLPNSRADVC